MHTLRHTLLHSGIVGLDYDLVMLPPSMHMTAVAYPGIGLDHPGEEALVCLPVGSCALFSCIGNL